MNYKLESCKVVVIQDQKAVLIVFDKGEVNTLTQCSKIFSQKDKADKAVKKIIDLKMTFEELTCLEKEVNKVKNKPTFKFRANQKRYQDKRKSEKMYAIYKAETYKGSQPHIITSLKKKRPVELLVPVELKFKNKVSMCWVRESKILTQKWIDKIGYERAFSLLLRVKNTVKKNPEGMLMTPNRAYVLSLNN